MNWKSASLHIGTMREGDKKKVTFFASVELPEIVSIVTSCGCAKASYDKISKELTVTYKAKKLPNHVRSRGSQIVTNYITIVYENGTVDSLIFKSKVII